MQGGPEAGAPDAPETGDGAAACGNPQRVGAQTLVPIACGQSSPSNVAFHGGRVYWTTYVAGTGTVVSAPADGGAAVTVASSQSWPWAVAVDDANVYWTEYNTGGAGSPSAASPQAFGSVWKAPLDGGAPVQLARKVMGPWGLALDATSVYFTSFFSSSTVPAGVSKVAIDGGSPTSLGSVAGDHALAVAVQGTTAYFTNLEGDVASVDVNGGPTTVIATASATAEALGLAVAGQNLVFTDPSTAKEAVYSVAESAGAPLVVLSTATKRPYGIAVGAGKVYWTGANANCKACGQLFAVPVGDAGAATQLLSGLSDPRGVAVDSSGAYFATTDDGTIWRLSPP